MSELLTWGELIEADSPNDETVWVNLPPKTDVWAVDKHQVLATDILAVVESDGLEFAAVFFGLAVKYVRWVKQWMEASPRPPLWDAPGARLVVLGGTPV